MRSNALCLARVAYCQHLPLMPIWFVPVDDAAAVLRINLEVDRPMHIASIRYFGCADSFQDGIKGILIHAKAIAHPILSVTSLSDPNTVSPGTCIRSGSHFARESP